MPRCNAVAAAAMIISFLLLGIENIGTQIEEPFRVLPLDAICKWVGAATAVQGPAAAPLPPYARMLRVYAQVD